MQPEPDAAPRVHVTIAAHDPGDEIVRCIAALPAAAAGVPYAVTVVDNASVDGTAERLASELAGVTLIRQEENTGFARAHNVAARTLTTDYWLLLNSDAVLAPGALSRLVEFLDETPRAALVSPRLVGDDGSHQRSAAHGPTVWRESLVLLGARRWLPPRWASRVIDVGPERTRAIRVGWTWATAALCRQAAVAQCGALSEAFFAYGEDLEWCMRLRAGGWEIWHLPDAVAEHREGSTARRLWGDDGRRAVIAAAYEQALAMHLSRAEVLAHRALRGAVDRRRRATARLPRPRARR